MEREAFPSHCCNALSGLKKFRKIEELVRCYGFRNHEKCVPADIEEKWNISHALGCVTVYHSLAVE